jgi:galactoside O-acetyltransferase
MKVLITSFAYFLLRLNISRHTVLNVSKDSRVKWWALRKTRGGSINIGTGSVVNCRIDFDSINGKVIIGQNCYIGASNLICHTGITLGDDVIISWGVTIVDHDSHTLNWMGRSEDVKKWMSGHKDWVGVKILPISIGDKVWIGFGATILKGCNIGEGAVVAAQSVVARDVPPYALVAGNPARVIRQLTSEEKAS